MKITFAALLLTFNSLWAWIGYAFFTGGADIVGRASVKADFGEMICGTGVSLIGVVFWVGILFGILMVTKYFRNCA